MAFHQNASGELRTSDKAYTVNTNSNASGRNTPMVAFSHCDNGRDAGETAPTIRSRAGVNTRDAGNGNVAMAVGSTVRRLTVTECERLQGFPDNHTRIPWRGKPASECPDGPRYKAIGNSMAVPVMRWLGERIQMVENITPAAPGDKGE